MQNPGSIKGKKSRSDQISISMHPGLIKMVDAAAEHDFTTRSDIIRTALLWYLRPQGRDLDQADPDVIVKTLQRRKAKAELSHYLKEHADEIDVYDS